MASGETRPSSPESTVYSPLDVHFGGDRAWATRIFTTNEPKKLHFTALNIRSEPTGAHAMVGLTYGTEIAEFDTFNISRSDQRIRLANSAYAGIAADELAKTIYKADDLKHDLRIFCLEIVREWARSRVKVLRADHSGAEESLEFYLEPYLLEGGGTLFFGDPGAGKSYLLQAMAVSIGSDLNHVWETQKRPVLYLSLERSFKSMSIRERQILEALGSVDMRSDITYLQAQGDRLDTVLSVAEDQIRRMDEKPIVILDSISRAGLGTLVDDKVAMECIDLMRKLETTWAAIGHVSKRDKEEIFGSMHFTAGADITVKVTSDEQVDQLGVSLQITKANDVKKGGPKFYALEFSGRKLINIRNSKQSEFPDLAIAGPTSRIQRMKDFIDTQNPASATAADIAEGTGINQADVSRMLKDSTFTKAGTMDRAVLWAISRVASS